MRRPEGQGRRLGFATEILLREISQYGNPAGMGHHLPESYGQARGGVAGGSSSEARRHNIPRPWPGYVMVGETGKMLVPLLGVIASLAIGVSVVAIVLQQQEREKRQATERQLRQAILENEDLQAQVGDLTKTKARLEEVVAKARQDLAFSEEQLAKAIQTQQSLSKAVEDREKEISRVTEDLAQARAQAKDAAAQLAKIQNERETIKRQLAQLQQAKSELESQVAAQSERPMVELPKVLVTNEELPRRSSSSSRQALAPPVDGQVVVVNREYDFVVMNLGKNHGLAIGQELRIVRGDQVLGTVKVEKVYDELSAAAILPDSQKENIREGDLVKSL